MGNRPPAIVRGESPCTGCTERYPACHDKCPKDNRGEYGYQAWRAEVFEVQKKRTAYNRLNRRYLWELRNG